MPNREFLETYPLYRKFKMEVPSTLEDLDSPAIHMYCPVCDSGQTFNMPDAYYATSGLQDNDAQVEGEVLRVVYQCTSCGEFLRYFLLKFDPQRASVMKVGQEPPWDVTPDRTLEKALASYAPYYRKGLICESQSYGIAAFAYYRRIVEDTIDKLLGDISDLIATGDREKYTEALEQVKKTKVTERKIELVKDLLPQTLRPNGHNPLSILYEVLSEGLHAESDDRCVELAAQVREVLVFLVNRIAQSKETGKAFTESMRRLLERKTARNRSQTQVRR